VREPRASDAVGFPCEHRPTSWPARGVPGAAVSWGAWRGNELPEAASTASLGARVAYARLHAAQPTRQRGWMANVPSPAVYSGLRRRRSPRTWKGPSAGGNGRHYTVVDSLIEVYL
jgi:hypothetical protein